MTVTTSVVIPVYNDPSGLRTTVESLLEQTADDYEVIVADNGSTDETPAIAREFARRETVRIVLEDDVQSSYAARNAGIHAAEGEVVGFLDADMWVDSDYVAAITATMLDEERRYMGCDVELEASAGCVARYRRATGFPVEQYVTEDHFAPTCCLVTHRDLFAAIGTFDERLVSGGDVEFGRRAHAAGFDVVYEPAITLTHPARGTVGDVLAQNRRIGRGREQVRYYHDDRFSVRPAWDPRRYLPVHPPSFREDVDGQYRDAGEFLRWYGLACLQKWSRTFGYLSERAGNAV